MKKFFCEKCQRIFVADGYKKEWTDAIYGHCFTWFTKCECGAEVKEYFPAKVPVKKKKVVCAGQNTTCPNCPYAQ